MATELEIGVELNDAGIREWARQIHEMKTNELIETIEFKMKIADALHEAKHSSITAELYIAQRLDKTLTEVFSLRDKLKILETELNL